MKVKDVKPGWYLVPGSPRHIYVAECARRKGHLRAFYIHEGDSIYKPVNVPVNGWSVAGGQTHFDNAIPMSNLAQLLLGANS